MPRQNLIQLFDYLMVFMREFFAKINLDKTADDKIKKNPSKQRVKGVHQDK